MVKRNAAAINFRLADDSGDAAITAGSGAFSSLLASSSIRSGNGNSALDYAVNGFVTRLDGVVGWSSTTSALVAPDTALSRDAAGILAQRNGANAQALRVYNTYTDASNYERGVFDWRSSVNVLTIGTENAGTGSARAMNLRTGGTDRWQISTSGNWLAATDNTYDIGASGANRPRHIYATQQVRAGFFNLTDVVRVYGVMGGNITLYNTAENDFGRLQFGGTTASFPALKRSTTALQARLADDSAFTAIQGKLKTDANAVAETITPTHTLTLYDAAGTAYKVAAVAA